MSRLDDLVALLCAGAADDDVRRELLALARGGGDPLSRYHYDPGHFTASGFVVTEDRQSMLLVHHRRLLRWLQPGGHIDPTDISVEAAARREVVEETGVRLSGDDADLIDLDVHPIPAGKGEPAHHHFDVRFLFVASDTMLAMDEDEVSDAGWFSLNEIVAGVGDSSVRRVARKLAGEW